MLNLIIYVVSPWSHGEVKSFVIDGDVNLFQMYNLTCFSSQFGTKANDDCIKAVWNKPKVDYWWRKMKQVIGNMEV